MPVEETWFVKQTLNSLGPLCLQYLRGEIQRSQVRKHVRVDYLVGRTYEEVARLDWLDREFRTELWADRGQPLTHVLRECCDHELASSELKKLSRRLWRPLTTYWRRRCQSAWRSFARALRAWLHAGAEQVGEHRSQQPAHSPAADAVHPSDVHAEDGKLPPEDALTLALDSWLVTAMLGDYVLQCVAHRPPPFIEPPYFWVPWNTGTLEYIYEHKEWDMLLDNWLRLHACVLEEIRTLRRIRDSIRRLPVACREKVLELAQSVASRFGLTQKSAGRNRPFGRLFLAVCQAGD